MMNWRNREMNEVLMKIVVTILSLGVVACVVTGCNNKDAAIKEASQAVSTESTELTEEEINKELEDAGVSLDDTDKLKASYIEEAKRYWEEKTASLNQYKDLGLKYEEFESIYLFYRIGCQDTENTADDVFLLTVEEIGRRYNQSDNSSLDPSTNIKQLEDGSYEFSDEFLGAVSTYDYFEGASEKEINDFLQIFAEDLTGMDGDMVDDLLSGFSAVGKLHEENESASSTSPSTPATKENNSNKGNSNNSQGNSNSTTEVPSNNPSESENITNNGDGTITAPGGILYEDGSNFGGGEHTIPDGFDADAFMNQ